MSQTGAEDVLNPARVLERCNQSPELGTWLLGMFARAFPAELQELDAAIAAGDVAEAITLAHKSRGAALTLAATRLGNALGDLETALGAGNGEHVRSGLALVHDEAERVLEAIPDVVRQLGG